MKPAGRHNFAIGALICFLATGPMDSIKLEANFHYLLKTNNLLNTITLNVVIVK